MSKYRELYRPNQMSKYRTMLINFMKSKNQILKDLTGIDLIDDADLTELAGWREDLCASVLDDLSTIDDARCCPWCLAAECSTCGYGIRNGHCDGAYMSGENPYVQICQSTKISEAISELPEIIDLVKRTKEAFRAVHFGNG